MSRVQIPSSAPFFVSRGRPRLPHGGCGAAVQVGRPRALSREAQVPERSRRGDPEAARRAVADLIRALGLDPATEPELAGTPARVAELYAEIFAGLDPGAEPTLATFPRPAGGEDLVVVRDLPFHSLCVHHFVPFFGRAHVAYLPGERLLGISGAARLLEFYARRPQLQERLTAQVADHLVGVLEPRGVAVVLEARHLCMEMRGVRRRGRVETRATRGLLSAPEWRGVLGPGGRRPR
ncbi:MAG: GTP cyclohydrolase I [Candidatus Eisenbacteria bacterium]|nr:GTP cyclohydrolase I [Candidatus Eisenbacteria bacterium]